MVSCILIDIQAIIASTLVDFPIITILFSTFLFGEEVVIILGFLSGLGLLSLEILVIFGFIGTFLSDILWFLVGKTLFKERVYKGKMHKNYHLFMRYIDRFTDNNFLALLFTRFFYFFRLFAIVHLSRRGMPWKTFLLYEIPIIIIWLILSITIGWFFGKTALIYIEFFKNVQIAIVAIVILALAFFLIKSFIRNRIEKKV